MTKLCCPGCFFSLNPLRIHKSYWQLWSISCNQEFYSWHCSCYQQVSATVGHYMASISYPKAPGPFLPSRAAKGSTCKLSLCTQSHQPTEEFLRDMVSKQQIWMGVVNLQYWTVADRFQLFILTIFHGNRPRVTLNCKRCNMTNRKNKSQETQKILKEPKKVGKPSVA